MIVHAPALYRKSDYIEVSARVELQTKRKKSLPETLWFRFPAESNPSTDADPFVVALLLLGMQLKENIEVRGPVSRKLALGLAEYQKRFHEWYSDRFHIIVILADSFRVDQDISPAPGVGVAFSGGVDSFYSFLELRPQITHTLFMAGFDMPLNLVDSARALSTSFQEMMEQEAVQFIHGSTNVRAFVNTVDWTNAHGTALAASALFFKKSFGQFVIPSSYTESTYPKWGTHPDLDPLLSTGELSFYHHGAQADRVTKLQTITKYPGSFTRLRVCWIQDLGLKNCGNCEKCVRTMIALSLVGALSSCVTFLPGALTRKKIRALPMRTHQARLFALELMGHAMKRHRYGVFFDLMCALIQREWFFRVGHLFG